MINRKKFFTGVRPIFGGRMTQKQVEGMKTILQAWERSSFTDLRWLSYMLATAFHETGARMQPIKEWGSVAYLTNLYDIRGRRPEVARQMGNTQPGDGPKYCGRGFVQLTWKTNYARAGRLLGIDLVGKPDLAMDPEVAIKIMFEGMTDADIIFEDKTSTDPGFSFTGKTLEDYFSDEIEDWVGARRIINGTDHAVMIAETALGFNSAIEYE